MDRRVAAAVGGLVVVALALVAWETFDDPGRGRHRSARDIPLADGFVVAKGSRLVGAVFPRPAGAIRNDPGGWSALLDVDGDAVTVFNVYLEQARRLGYLQTTPNPSSPCSARDPQSGPIGTTTSTRGPIPEPVGQVLCSGTYYREDGRSVSIQLRVCSTCDMPVSAARITTYAGTTLPPVPISAIVPAAPAPSLALTGSRHRLAWSTRASAGAPDDQLTARDGSRLVSPTVSLMACTSDASTVVEVTGDPKRVFASYTAAPVARSTLGPTRTRVGDDDVTVWSDGLGTRVTLVEGAHLRRPLLAVDVCGG